MCQIFDYTFGPIGEYAYLEYADFEFTTDGIHYEKLMRWEVVDRKKSAYTEVVLKDFKSIKKLDIWYSKYPGEGNIWWNTEKDSIYVRFYHDLMKPYLPLSYFLSSGEKINHIFVTGKWHVDGLHCSDIFVREVYPIDRYTEFKTELKTDSKQKNGESPDIKQTTNNVANVFSEADVIVVNGIERGDQIKVYTMSGSLINVTYANNYLVKIKLPASQMYIVRVGQGRYKVAI